MLPKPRVGNISGRQEWTSEEFLDAAEGLSKRRTEVSFTLHSNSFCFNVEGIDAKFY